MIIYTYHCINGNKILLSDGMSEIKDLFNSLGLDKEDISNYPDHERIIQSLVSKYPDQNNYDEVLLKVVMINTLYSAGLNTIKSTDTISVNDMAKHIVEMDEKENLSELIKSPEKDSNQNRAVHLIAQKEGFKDAYSFASKYCNWHNMDGFAVMDTYSKGVMYYLNKSTETYESISKYDRFSKITIDFRDSICSGISLKELDMFLWLYGKTHNLGI